MASIIIVKEIKKTKRYIYTHKIGFLAQNTEEVYLGKWEAD